MGMWSIASAGAPPARTLRMALEPRLMLDGDAALALADAARPAEPAAPAGAAARHDVVFVFSDVADRASLTTAIPGAAETIMIDAGADGLARMAEALQGRHDIDAIHVLAHGTSGAISLGQAVLDIASIAARGDDLAAIGGALTADGDLLFYGCDTGAGEAGRLLAHSLAQATGADVALSDDATGAAALGGDWDLEVRAGAIEAAALSAPEWGALLALQTSQVNADPAGNDGAGASEASFVSRDGRYVAFTSAVTGADLATASGTTQVFLRDTQTGTITLISRAANDTAGNASSVVTDISDDGRYVVFTSAASNLVAGDTNARTDVFVYDTQAAAATRVIRVSVTTANGQIAGQDSSAGTISANGQYVAFLTAAPLAEAGPPDNAADVYVWNRNAGAGASVVLASTGAGGAAGAPQLSSTGTMVAYTQNNNVYVRNLTNAAVTQIATNASSPSLSADGAQVAFVTSTSLLAGDGDALADVYIYDDVAHTQFPADPSRYLTLASATATASADSPSLSGGGDFLAYRSNGQIYLWSRSSGTFHVSVSNAGVAASSADLPAIAADGGHVTFRATGNLDATVVNRNGLADIYVNTGAVVTPASQGLVPFHLAQHFGLPMPPPPDAPAEMLLGMAGGDLPALAPMPITFSSLAAMPAAPPPLAPLSIAPIGSFDGRPPAFRPDRPPPPMPRGHDSQGAATVTAELVTQVNAGADITLAEAKQALESQGVDGEAQRAHLAAVAQAIKTARTTQLAGALHEIAREPAAADAFSRADGQPLRNVAIGGKRVAVLFGVDSYKGTLPRLGTPGNDVAALSTVLAERFGYQTVIAKDATKADIVDLIRSVGERMDPDGSLIVYYAGHGYAVEATGQGYWLPADARADSAANWVSTADLTGYLGQIKASQIMVVSDSCYSGSMTREMRLTSDAIGLPRDQIVQRRSVTALSSGGEEPVADGGPGGHSVFAGNLIKTLEQAKADTIGFEVFGQVRAEVARELPQVPTYGALTSAGHAGATDYVIGGR